MSRELTVWSTLFDFYLFLVQLKAILSKVHKSDNFESRNSQILSFTNIQGLCFNFVWCGFFHESNFPYILSLSETNLDDTNDCRNFSFRSCFPLIWKDSVSMVLEFVWRSDFLLHRTCFKKLRGFKFVFLTGFTSFGLLLPFPVSIAVFVFVHSVWCY